VTPTGNRRARDALRAEWRAAGVYPDLTIGEAIRAGCSAHAEDHIVFARVDGDTTAVTLGDLLQRSLARAERLAGAGVVPGDMVVVQAPADLSGTEILAAVWLLGAVAVPITTTATAREVDHAVRQTGATCAVVVPEWRGRDLVTPFVEAPGLRQVIAVGHDAVDGAVPFDSIRLGPVPTTGGRPHGPSSVACVLYTSGSTAEPKGVQHSHETLLCGLAAVPADATSRMLGTFPAGHVASLLSLLRPLAAGGTTVVMDRWSARAAAALIEEHRITTSAGTPFFLSTLLDEAERSGRDISSLGRFLCGAAAVPPALVARSEAAGIVTWRTYGSTEHPAISSGGPMDPPDKRRLTDGRVTPGNEVRLLDEEGAEVVPGEEGEIVARGPKQFLGYQDPSADDGAFVDGTWFRTGDLGLFDEDGYLVVTDRVKDIIIRGGENISAREVEEALAGHPAIAEVAVCAAADEVWGEAVCAVVVPRPGESDPTVESLAGAAESAGLAAHKRPTRVVVTDALPRTATGKVRRRDLRPLL
jgi:acyl-CoA synthetase (AMP-forming)/AMP-acid ligase II